MASLLGSRGIDSRQMKLTYKGKGQQLFLRGGNGEKASPVSRSVFEFMKKMYKTNQRWRHDVMCRAH